MEYIIDRLLREFEQGNLTRRQLVQTLAMGAAAAAPVAASENSGFKAVTVNHISYQVADYAKTRDFYAGLLGMKVSQDNGKQCYVSFGDTFLLPRNGRAGAPTPRIDHVAYTIETWDKDGTEEELRRRGLEPRPDTADSFHVKDPDGFDVQISSKKMKA